MLIPYNLTRNLFMFLTFVVFGKGQAPAPRTKGNNMRLRRLELVIICVTLAFVCFLSGYFTGVRTSVSVISVGPQEEGQQLTGTATVQNTPATVAPLPPSSSGEQEPGNTVAQPAGGAAQTQEPASVPAVSDGRININRASHSELMDLPGIGRILAERIIEYRNAYGPYNRIEDVRNVSGIGERRFDTIKDKITVG